VRVYMGRQLVTSKARPMVQLWRLSGYHEMIRHSKSLSLILSVLPRFSWKHAWVSPNFKPRVHLASLFFGARRVFHPSRPSLRVKCFPRASHTRLSPHPVLSPLHISIIPLLHTSTSLTHSPSTSKRPTSTLTATITNRRSASSCTLHAFPSRAILTDRCHRSRC
jgi:hypothetical protein